MFQKLLHLAGKASQLPWKPSSRFIWVFETFKSIDFQRSNETVVRFFGIQRVCDFWYQWVDYHMWSYSPGLILWQYVLCRHYVLRCIAMVRQKHVLRLMTVLEQMRKKSENQYFRTFYLTIFETFENIDFQRSYGTFSRHFPLKLSYNTKVVSWQCTFSVLYCAIFTVRPELTIPCSCNQIGREEMWNYSTTLFQKKCHNSLGNGGS